MRSPHADRRAAPGRGHARARAGAAPGREAPRQGDGARLTQNAVPARAGTPRGMTMAMDVVDYVIKGSEMQFVEVELDPGEAAVGEAGSMMFMEAGVVMDTIFGDGSQSTS